VKVTEAVWRAKGEELFGADEVRWEFVCPTCGKVMSIEKARALPAEQLATLRAGKWSPYQECVGRYVPSLGCNWAAYGLFSGPVFVERDGGGKLTPVFDFGGKPFTTKAAAPVIP
jgi:hypothetical protein